MPKFTLSEFADKINEIMPLLTKEFIRQQENELYKGKITLPQFFILDFLLNKQTANMTEISRFMGVSTAAVTGIVDRLVKYGYVERGFDPVDRRIIKIKPTEKGYTLVKKINQQRRKAVMDIFSQVSESDRSQYLRILLRVHDILSKKEEKVLP